LEQHRRLAFETVSQDAQRVESIPRKRSHDERVVFSKRSHLSGITVRVDTGRCEEGMVSLELYFVGDEKNPVRAGTIDLANLERAQIDHVYWEPIETSARRFFWVRVSFGQNGVRQEHAPRPKLLDLKLIYSSPQAYHSLPRALLFSPVSQCNLNCTHCISRPTREKLRFASERVWDAVGQVTRGEKFVHLATDYSGDILFDERSNPGTLGRIIAFDAPFRIDTNATCLDDDIIDMLLASRLQEINFSIDSMDADVYRSIRRGSLPLSEVLAKVAHFMSRRATAGKQLHTIMSFVLMRSNAVTLKPALAFAREHGIDHVNVVPLLAFTEDMVDEIFFWEEAAYADLHEELSIEADRLGVALAIQPPVKRWREDDIHAPCEVPWATAAITANGDVMACCVPGTVIGNLNEQNLDEIWNGPEFATFRSRVNTPDPPAPCRNCGMARVHNNRKAYAPVRYTQSLGLAT
jgi:radical SAM protein with 4Fe4S-binding SPASM domain